MTKLCETCEHFFKFHIVAKWEEFLQKVKEHTDDTEIVAKSFPFTLYFHAARDPLFEQVSFIFVYSLVRTKEFFQNWFVIWLLFV
jgi:hypothetical protein